MKFLSQRSGEYKMVSGSGFRVSGSIEMSFFLEAEGSRFYRSCGHFFNLLCALYASAREKFFIFQLDALERT